MPKSIAPILAGAAALLLLTRRNGSRPAAPRPAVPGIGTLGGIEVTPGTGSGLILHSIPLHITGVPIYDGMPTMPAGYQAIRVWHKNEPRPDRFDKWAPLMSNKDPEDYGKEFQDTYWFGVNDIANRSLEFYVVGKPSNKPTCNIARRSLYPVQGFERVGVAGQLPPMWECELAAPESWEIIARPAFNHPLAPTGP